MKLIQLIILIISLMSIGACSGEDSNSGPEQPSLEDLPGISVSDVRGTESSNESSTLPFQVSLSKSSTVDISFDYSVSGLTAEPSVDFENVSGQGVIAAGTLSTVIDVKILDDQTNEVEEKVELVISNAINATLQDERGIGIINDNDEINYADDGYEAQTAYFGYELTWSDEFEGAALDPESYTYEIGDGCPNLCGWGNEELQRYTDEEKNVTIENGNLVMTATKSGSSNYESARIITKDKREFRYGRIDIRAKLPKGQGLWPALWMLGANIDDVSWPACGEIDIMEHVGHKENVTSAAAHWGDRNQGFSNFKTQEYKQDQSFHDSYHLFTLVWEPNAIDWYVDDTKYMSLRPSDTSGKEWRFNQSFFFIFNVAIGGRLPGNPDETTEFPQSMEIDFIRVFQ